MSVGIKGETRVATKEARNRCDAEKNGTDNDILTFEGSHISEDASLYDPTSVLRDFTPDLSLHRSAKYHIQEFLSKSYFSAFRKRRLDR